MPGKPIEIRLDAETKGAERGIDRAADALDDLKRSLDKADGAADDMRRTLDRDLDAALDEVRRNAKRAGDALGDDIKRGTDRAGDGLDNFKDEARQSARESAASFSGSFEDIADLGQEALANVFVGFGPLATAAGIAAAAGLGSLWTSIQQESEATKQRISDMYADMIESGMDYVSAQFVTDELEKIFDKADDAAISWGNLQKVVEETGLSQATVARAFAGDASAGLELTRRLEEQQAALRDRSVEAGEAVRDGYYAEAQALGEQQAALSDVQDLWGGVSGQIDSARERADGYREAVGQIPTSIDTTVSANVQLAQAEIERFARQRPTITVGLDTSELDRKTEEWRRRASRDLTLSADVRGRHGGPV